MLKFAKRFVQHTFIHRSKINHPLGFDRMFLHILELHYGSVHTPHTTTSGFNIVST